MHGGRERIVEIEQGPFKLFADDTQDYYEGWCFSDTGDPEPWHVVFAAASIVREVE